MPVIDRTLWFNGLIDDDGSGSVGSIWQKLEVGKFLDSIDAALALKFSPIAHSGTHWGTGSDPIPLDFLAPPTDNIFNNASTAQHGLLPKLPGSTTLFLRGDGTWASAVSAHHATHEAGGGDAIKLDDLAAPDDTLDLDVSTVRHGLAPKLPGGTASFLRGDGTYATPSGVTPAAHAATHGSGGSDPITIAESQVTNLATDLTGLTTNKADKTDPRFTDARTPTAHAASHKTGGGDVIKLDELGSATDVTTLNASTFAHGLLPKLPGGTTTFLRGDGAFVAPTSTPGPHATTHANGGTDPVDVAALAGFPGGTTAFLRADGQFVIPPNGSAGGGNVTGPVTSVVGHLASFNNATGTLLADTGIALTAVVVTTDARLSDARTPTAHAVSHDASGSDPVTVAESQVTNLVADLAGKVTSTDPRLTDARTPTAHAPTHKAGGSDAIKLDEFAAPTDVTTLNVSTTAHGLAPKLPGNTTTFLRGDGSYATPSGSVVGPVASVVGNLAAWNDTTGTTLADGGVLLSNVARRDQANTFAQQQTFTLGPLHDLSPIFVNPTNAANQRQWRLGINTSGQFYAAAYDDAGNYLTAAWIANRNGDASVGLSLTVPQDLTVAGVTFKSVTAYVALTDGATPALDASLGALFRLDAGGDRTIAVPTNPRNGQKIVIQHFASGGARTLSLNTGANGFRFGTDVAALTQTASGKTDYIGAIWNGPSARWDVVAYAKGY